MSNQQQPEQHASATSASATRDTTTLSSKPNCVQPPVLIHLQLTRHDLPLSDMGLLSWRIFLEAPAGLLGRWTTHTTYKSIGPDSFLHTWPWINATTPTLTLGSTQTYETTEAAERDTYAALMILHSLGFVKVSTPDMKNIAMRWGYPDRQWLNKTMPQLVEELGIKRDKVGVPDVRWLEYIQWEVVGSRASEASASEASR